MPVLVLGPHSASASARAHVVLGQILFQDVCTFVTVGRNYTEINDLQRTSIRKRHPTPSPTHKISWGGLVAMPVLIYVRTRAHAPVALGQNKLCFEDCCAVLFIMAWNYAEIIDL